MGLNVNVETLEDLKLSQLTWNKERSGRSSGQTKRVGDSATFVEVPRDEDNSFIKK